MMGGTPKKAPAERLAEDIKREDLKRHADETSSEYAERMVMVCRTLGFHEIDGTEKELPF